MGDFGSHLAMKKIALAMGDESGDLRVQLAKLLAIWSFPAFLPGVKRAVSGTGKTVG